MRQPILRPFGALPQFASTDMEDYLAEDPAQRVKRLQGTMLPGHSLLGGGEDPFAAEARAEAQRPQLVPPDMPRREQDIMMSPFSAADQNDHFAKQAEQLNAPDPMWGGSSYAQRVDNGDRMAFRGNLPAEYQPQQPLTLDQIRALGSGQPLPASPWWDSPAD
jgi:hypothetical protein